MNEVKTLFAKIIIGFHIKTLSMIYKSFLKSIIIVVNFMKKVIHTNFWVTTLFSKNFNHIKSIYLSVYTKRV